MDSRESVFFWTYSRSVSGYRIRLTVDPKDIEKIRELRTLVFGKLESIETIERLFRRDMVSQHLIVENESNGNIVGCYRLTSSQFSTDFDSSDGHDLSVILSRPGLKLELSYACVHPDCRNGFVIRLLLSAIREYCQHYQINTVFGYASLKTTDHARALRVYNILTKKESDKKDEKKMAPLLHFYFQLGAIVLAPPFFDQNFNCFDFFMMLDLGAAPENILKQISHL